MIKMIKMIKTNYFELMILGIIKLAKFIIIETGFGKT